MLRVEEKSPLTIVDEDTLNRIDEILAGDKEHTMFSLYMEILALPAVASGALLTGRGGNHIWISRRFPGEWHRICIITDREGTERERNA